jgi:hypothetical protein
VGSGAESVAVADRRAAVDDQVLTSDEGAGGARPAISCGSPTRRSGVSDSRRSSTAALSRSGAANCVRIRPGEIALTRTFCGPHSTARLRASCAPAALDMPYRPIALLPRTPEMLDTRITLPPPRSAIFGTTRLVSQWTLRRLTVIVRSQSASDAVLSGPM